MLLLQNQQTRQPNVMMQQHPRGAGPMSQGQSGVIGGQPMIQSGIPQMAQPGPASAGQNIFDIDLDGFM